MNIFKRLINIFKCVVPPEQFTVLHTAKLSIRFQSNWEFCQLIRDVWNFRMIYDRDIKRSMTSGVARGSISLLYSYMYKQLPIKLLQDVAGTYLALRRKEVLRFYNQTSITRKAYWTRTCHDIITASRKKYIYKHFNHQHRRHMNGFLWLLDNDIQHSWVVIERKVYTTSKL